MAAEVIAWISEQIETRPELMVCRTDDDVRTAKREGKLGIFYRLQGPSPIGLDLDLVWFYKQAGVDLMQIAYNTRNPFANGATERIDGGLRTLGVGLVKACNSALVIVDVSHTGERSQLDAIEASSEPVIISHGNAFERSTTRATSLTWFLKPLPPVGARPGLLAIRPLFPRTSSPRWTTWLA